MRHFALYGWMWIACTAGLRAQIPVEVFAGHQQLQHEFFFFKDLDSAARVSLFSMARFAVDYQSQTLNSSFISSQLTYNFSPSWGISGGGILADNAFTPIVAVSFVYANPRGDFFMNLFPTLILGEELQVELFGLLFYTPQLSKRWSLFSQAIFGTTFDQRFSRHLFSYQQLRLGLGYRNWFQAGLGMDQNFFSTPGGPLYFNNVGPFLRKEF